MLQDKLLNILLDLLIYLVTFHSNLMKYQSLAIILLTIIIGPND